jgi:hypothetical protein
MDENLLLWMPRLAKERQHLQNIAWVMDCPIREVPFKCRQETIKRLLEASMLFSKDYYPDYAATAAILQQNDGTAFAWSWRG